MNETFYITKGNSDIRSVFGVTHDDGRTLEVTDASGLEFYKGEGKEWHRTLRKAQAYRRSL
jgi:hypothetical protein